MTDFLIQVLAIVVGTFILYALGFGSTNHKITINTVAIPGKKWKFLIVLGIVMIISGLLLFGNNVQNSGFQNPFTGMGLSLGMLGLFIFWIGKFGNWWHK